MTQRVISWVWSYAQDLFESWWSSRSTSQTQRPTENALPRAVSVSQHTLAPCYIKALPLELLVETFKYLGWRELLDASTMCRTWHRATQSRHLWLHLAKEIESAFNIGPMEEPMGEYTVRELQHWVLQRLRIQETWNIPSAPLAFKKRTIELEDLKCAILLPGGRWLLATDVSGRLYSYDLDASNLRPQLLVGPAPDEAVPTEGPYEISYWVDPSKRKLSLRVALWDGLPIEEKEKILIRIYQVELLGHGEKALLDAQLLAVVRDNEDMIRSALALTGKFLTGCRYTNPAVLQLFLLEYATADAHDLEEEGENQICVQFQTATSEHAVYITPTDEIIVINGDYIDIFTIHQLQAHDSRDTTLLPLHHILCGGALQHCTPPFTYQECTWLVFGHEDEIHLTRFSSNDVPLIIKIRDQPLYGRSDIIVTFTPAAGLIIHPSWDTDLLSFFWDENLNSVAIAGKRVTMQLDDDFGYIEPGGMEKGIGRVVFYATGIGECFVLDTI